MNMNRSSTGNPWEERYYSKELEYGDLLEKLPDILASGISERTAERMSGYLSNPDFVLGTGMSPFRYLEAYYRVENTHSWLARYFWDALEDAARVSVDNLKGFEYGTRTLIASDISEEMLQPVTEGSVIYRYDVGIFLSFLLHAADRLVETGIFGNGWLAAQFRGAVLGNTGQMRLFSRFFKEGVGQGTRGCAVIDHLVGKAVPMDRVMLFTDHRLGDLDDGGSGLPGGPLRTSWAAYKSLFPGARLYLFDLSGEGECSVERDGEDVCLVSGWDMDVFNRLD